MVIHTYTLTHQFNKNPCIIVYSCSYSISQSCGEIMQNSELPLIKYKRGESVISDMLVGPKWFEYFRNIWDFLTHNSLGKGAKVTYFVLRVVRKSMITQKTLFTTMMSRRTSKKNRRKYCTTHQTLSWISCRRPCCFPFLSAEDRNVRLVQFAEAHSNCTAEYWTNLAFFPKFNCPIWMSLCPG